MKSKKILATLLALSVLSTSALVGCGDKKEDPKGNESGKDNSGKPEMDKEQVLNVFGGEPQLLDPTIASITTTWEGLAPIHEGLTRVVGTESGVDKIEAGVAEKWEGNADSTEFTFKLRKDAKWQDGTPVTAKDFEYSLKRVCDPRVAAEYSSFVAPIIKGAADAIKLTGKDDATIDAALEKVGVKAVDDYTLKFELVQSTPYFLQLSYFPTFKPVQKKAIEEFGAKYGTEADMTMSNGPYILKEWKHNGNLTYEKNPNYWDKDHVYLEKITKHIIQDSNSGMQALFNGEVDRGGVSKPEWVEKFDASGNFDIKKTPGYNVETLIFNPKTGPASNLKIRKAFATSFDRDQYGKDMANGNNIPGYQFIPDNVTIEGKSFQEEAGKPQYTKKLVEEVKDPKALLIEGMKEAGLGDDPSKLEISIHMRGDNEFCKKQGEWFQNKWKEKLGVNVNVVTSQYQIMYEKMKNGEFDIAVGGWSADFDDPSNFIDIYNSDGGYYSYLGWKNADFDKAITDAANEKDPKKRVELYSKAEKILTYDDVLVTPFEHGLTKFYTRKYVKDFKAPGLADYCMDYKGVYIKGR
ncbi:oligopeptide transport system substrate-binding protein [Clostridium collagenovorans DSM 3089]|uniref:Oligopeptide transport system substrate-binding protein n=1 Tax=Clostridium collagenovorans DSM 3089 TaxID=1121306 RepID=A0A1M5VS99_9CLOT|nr:peptide ABC transporter substrate-binding protein [Clostridium collagenovorans]SHH78135.1 oligopeptide transport system substrate-binding protein [Clostridium collagenovorans DSM 3089]